jgi:hypothetical protein
MVESATRSGPVSGAGAECARGWDKSWRELANLACPWLIYLSMVAIACRRVTSRPGGAPNMRRYSRPNCDGLS